MMNISDASFFKTIRDFLTVYLPKQRRVSNNTVQSYRVSLNLYVDFLTEKLNLPLQRLSYDNVNRETVTAFLDWLQNERGCSAATRNQRLMAIRSFAKYSAMIDAANLYIQSEVGKVPVQKSPSKIVEFLSDDSLKALLEQPNRSKRNGLRDSFFMILMYDTAARCQEMLDLKLRDFVLDFASPYVMLTGKGNKTRAVPLMDKTVQHLNHYLDKFHPAETRKNDDSLFYTIIHGRKNQMSPDTVAHFMKKYGKSAKPLCADFPDNIHPHQLRHTRAIGWYRGGIPLVLVSELLGHANVNTTQVYAYADTEMKRRAINKAMSQDESEQEAAVWQGDDDLIKKLYGLR